MSSELLIVFGGLSVEAVSRLEKIYAFLEALPKLSRGRLVACDLAKSQLSFACAARFGIAVPDSMVARLRFWAWQAGGSLCSVPSSKCTRRAAEHAQQKRIAVEPASLATAAASLLDRAPHPTAPDLAMHLPLAHADGLAFDRLRGALFVPSQLTPPMGDEVPLVLQTPGGEQVRLCGVVTSIRAAGADGAGSPAGFVVALALPEPRAIELLERHTGKGTGATSRRAPRYPVRATARVLLRPSGTRLAGATESTDGEDPARDYVENLSQGGAFVRTARRPPPEGSSIVLQVVLPGGSKLSAPAEVVHTNDGGMGVRFRLDGDGEALLASAIGHLSLRQRRALVIDDDALARRMLGDALAQRGFEVFTADDGVSGLRELTEQLLGMDVLVTDWRMPNMDGEELIRKIRIAGGETDLAIVVVSGSADPILSRRLTRAGADLVLSKAQGPDRIAEAADELAATLARVSTLAGHGSDAPTSVLGPEVSRWSSEAARTTSPAWLSSSATG